MVESLRSDVNALKLSNIDLIKLCDNNSGLKSVKKQDLYSEKVKGLNTSKVIVKPVNVSQTSLRTKSDLYNNIDPVICDLKIKDVRTTRGNSLIISSDIVNCEKFEKVIADKLPNKYTVSKLSPLYPKVRIVGFTNDVVEGDFIEVLTNQNKELFDFSYCRLIKYWATHKNKEVFQAIVQIDENTYNHLLQQKSILVGYSSCSVFDAVDVLRCFKCNGFNHTSVRCTKDLSCPLCALKHSFKDCPNVNKPHSCSNCSLLKAKNPQVQTSHAVWDYNSCLAYKNALSDHYKNLCFCPIAQLVLDFLDFFNFCQYNTTPNFQGRTLDLVISNRQLVVDDSTVNSLSSVDAYHPPLSFTLETGKWKQTKSVKKYSIDRFNFKRADFPRLYQSLLDEEWSFLPDQLNINLACNLFYDRLYMIIKKYVPLAKPRYEKYPPWYSSGVIWFVKEKSHVFSQI